MARIPEQVYQRLPRRLPEEWVWSNRALHFNGVAQYISAPYLLPADFTLEVWFKQETPTGGWVTLGGWASNVSNPPYMLLWSSFAFVDEMRWIIRDDAGVIQVNLVYTPTVLDRFYCAGVTKDGNVWTLYVNGEPRDTAIWALAGVTVNQLAFACNPRAIPTNFFNGVEDEIRIIPSALSGDEIRRSYLRGYARREFDARLVYRLEDGVGLTTTDESGYGNNGSLLPVLSPPTWEKVSQYELLAEAGV